MVLPRLPSINPLPTTEIENQLQGQLRVCVCMCVCWIPLDGLVCSVLSGNWGLKTDLNERGHLAPPMASCQACPGLQLLICVHLEERLSNRLLALFKQPGKLCTHTHAHTHAYTHTRSTTVSTLGHRGIEALPRWQLGSRWSSKSVLALASSLGLKTQESLGERF